MAAALLQSGTRGTDGSCATEKAFPVYGSIREVLAEKVYCANVCCVSESLTLGHKAPAGASEITKIIVTS